MATSISCCAIIPARFGSTRFPGKPLASILGKPMLQRTYEAAKRCTSLERVWIATDHPLIAEAARSWGAPLLLTSPDCTNGSERIAEALLQLPEVGPQSIVVNVQGDEPLIEPAAIEAVVQGLITSCCPMATASIRLDEELSYRSRSVVKCVVNQQGEALYFSRAPLGSWQACQGEAPAIRHHIGLYSYRRWFLELYGKLSATPLQKAEDLEQLRVLEHGYSIRVMPVEQTCCGVDTPEDIAKVERILRENGTFARESRS